MFLSNLGNNTSIIIYIYTIIYSDSVYFLLVFILLYFYFVPMFANFFWVMFQVSDFCLVKTCLKVLAALNLSMGREIQYGGLVSLRLMMDASRQNRYFWSHGSSSFNEAVPKKGPWKSHEN